ncbi:MAG: TraB/GumN family protein [Patescibacteria group bacterium]
MKRRILIAAVILLCVLATLAGAKEQPRGLCWEVKSGQTTVHILGSIHMMQKDMYPLSAPIEEAFTKADKLVVEIDAEAHASELQTLILKNGIYPSNDSLKNHITPETYALIEKKAAEYGLNMSVLNACKPWYIATLLSVLGLQKAGYLPEEGVDLYFLKKAKAVTKAVVELESVEFQINLLTTLDELVLEDTVRELDRMEEIIGGFTSAWKKGDAKVIEDLTFVDLDDPLLSEFYERFYFARNRAWAEKIAGFLQGKEKYFVVVGAGHAVGPKGLIELLKTKGYSATQL